MRAPALILLLTSISFGLARQGVGQSATYSYFGTGARQGCSPVQPVVGHQTLGMPVLGSSFSVEVAASNGNCGYLCNMRFLLTGFSRTSFGGVALPAQFGCGSLLVSPDLAVPVPPGVGNHVVTLPIPNQGSLAGFEFYQQAIAVTSILSGVHAVAPGHGGHARIGY